MPNIIVKDRSQPVDVGVRNDPIKRDGKAEPTKEQIECDKKGIEIIKDVSSKLNKKKIKHRIQTMKETGERAVVIGEFNREPFMVYLKWIVVDGGLMYALVVTRYKGKDHEFIPPEDVLK